MVAARPGVNDVVVIATIMAKTIGQQLKPIVTAATKSSATLTEQKTKLTEGKKYH